MVTDSLFSMDGDFADLEVPAADPCSSLCMAQHSCSCFLPLGGVDCLLRISCLHQLPQARELRILGPGNRGRPACQGCSQAPDNPILALLQALAAMRQKYGFCLAIDEAHATLVCGHSGGGAAEAAGVADQVAGGPSHAGCVDGRCGSRTGRLVGTAEGWAAYPLSLIFLRIAPGVSRLVTRLGCGLPSFSTQP